MILTVVADVGGEKQAFGTDKGKDAKVGRREVCLS